MRADVARVRRAKGEEISLLVEGELGLRGEVARVIVGEKAFAPLRAPLHRAAETLRRPRHQHQFGKDVVTRAEAAAHLARHEAHGAFRHAERHGRVCAKALHSAGGRVDGVAALGEGGERPAQLERHTSDAVDRGVERDDVRGRAECLFHVVTHICVDEERGLQRQHFILHLHGIRAVPCCHRRLRDHHGHRLADEARPVRGQHRVGRDVERRAVAVLQLHLVRIDGDRPRRDRLEAVGDCVLAGQDRDHARGVQSSAD